MSLKCNMCNHECHCKNKKKDKENDKCENKNCHCISCYCGGGDGGESNDRYATRRKDVHTGG